MMAARPCDLPAEGRKRAQIETLTPQVDGGRFAVKRVVGEVLSVEADCFADGHDVVRAIVRWRRANLSDGSADGDGPWQTAPMTALANDRWRGLVRITECGRWWYTVSAWVDSFLSWRGELARRSDAADIRSALLAGAALVESAAVRAAASDAEALLAWAERLRAESAGGEVENMKTLALDTRLAELAGRYPDQRFATLHPPLPLDVDRQRAGFGAWYEMFPRSAADTAAHGTFADCLARLPAIAAMGFDVLYLPPIHPIGRERRKGANGSLVATAADVGSPWAVGASEGGHHDIHPQLGSLDDFRRLVAAAREQAIEIALDIAFQCAPDHPWVAAHPDWFRRRPDGSVQYAENPPKKYQDIYPFDFESDDWRALWQALADVFRHWIGEGVRIFRVDNPHTKAFPFWEWCIAGIRRDHPEIIFLAEAFTRPSVMHRLAKIGFSQSYTYFTWRNTRAELTAYFEELGRAPGRDYFRPSVWPNTPDILPEYLQMGGRPAFIVRLALAATLSATYGIYGPAFELIERRPREVGSEEYLDSEKYQLRQWPRDSTDSLAALIGRINRIRRENAALQTNIGLRFLPIDNEQLIAFAKRSDDGMNVIVVVVNLDPHNVHSGWLTLDFDLLGITGGSSFQMHELLSGIRYLWSEARNFIRLDPQRMPVHIFAVRQRLRSEHDFDYFL